MAKCLVNPNFDVSKLIMKMQSTSLTWHTEDTNCTKYCTCSETTINKQDNHSHVAKWLPKWSLYYFRTISKSNVFDKHSSTVWLRNIYNSITGLTSLYRLTSSRSCCRSCSTSISFSSTRDKRTRSVSNICSSRWSSSVSSAFCCSSWTRASLICRHMTLTVDLAQI